MKLVQENIKEVFILNDISLNINYHSFWANKLTHVQDITYLLIERIISVRQQWVNVGVKRRLKLVQ